MAKEMRTKRSIKEIIYQFFFVSLVAFAIQILFQVYLWRKPLTINEEIFDAVIFGIFLTWLLPLRRENSKQRQ